MTWIFLFVIIIALSILYYLLVFGTQESDFYRDIKTGNIYIEKDNNFRRVKITNMYYDNETKRDIIEYTYIDNNDNVITEYYKKSLSNFISNFDDKK